MYVVHLELHVCKVRHLGVCPYGFEMDMSERVHFQVLYFYILQHFTLAGGLEAIKGGDRDVGVHPSSQLHPILCPWVILLKNTFI